MGIVVMLLGLLAVWAGSEIGQGIMNGALKEQWASVRMIVFVLAMNVVTFGLGSILVGAVLLISQW